jgi:hypothetical protein
MRPLEREHQVQQKPTPEQEPNSEARRRRDAFARNLCARICDDRRTHDELRVIDDVLVGLEKGADLVGPLDLSRDDRDWDEEAAQECRDLLAYLAMDRIARQHRRRERIECESADGVAARVEPGLAELRDAEPVTAPRPRVGLQDDAGDVHHLFDVGDTEGAGG